MREAQIGKCNPVRIIRSDCKTERAGPVAPVTITLPARPACIDVLIVGSEKDALPGAASVRRLVDNRKLAVVLSGHVSSGRVEPRHSNEKRKVVRCDSGYLGRPIWLPQVKRIDAAITEVRA